MSFATCCTQQHRLGVIQYRTHAVAHSMRPICCCCCCYDSHLGTTKRARHFRIEDLNPVTIRILDECEALHLALIGALDKLNAQPGHTRHTAVWTGSSRQHAIVQLRLAQCFAHSTVTHRNTAEQHSVAHRSKRSQAAYTSGTAKPMCPKPRGSLFPL